MNIGNVVIALIAAVVVVGVVSATLAAGPLWVLVLVVAFLIYHGLKRKDEE